MHNVSIYTTPTCFYCKKTKEFFGANNVSYTERDVTTDEVARNDMIARTGQLAVPVIDIDGKIVIGFDQAALKEALEIS